MSSVVFSPDGQYLLSAGADKSIILWNPHNAKIIKTFKGHSGVVTRAVFSPDGTKIASCSDDLSIRLWDLKTGKLIKKITGHTNAIMTLAFGPNGKQLISGGFDKLLRLWDVQTGIQLKTSHGDGRSEFLGVDFSPDGQHVVAGNSFSFGIFNVTRPNYPILLEKRFGADTSGNYAAALSPDGTKYVTASYRQLRFWNMKEGKVSKTIDSIDATSIAFSNDSKQLVSYGDRTITVWDVETGKIRIAIENKYDGTSHTDFVGSIVFSQNSNMVLTGSDDRTIKLWDVKNEEIIKTFEGHEGAVKSVAFSPSGKQIVSGSEDSTIKLWDVKTGNMIRTFIGHSAPVLKIVYSPNGKLLITGSQDNTIKLWDVQSGKLIKTFNGHSSWVRDVVFSRDGQQLVSCSADNTLKLWDIQKSKLLHTFFGHEGSVINVAFNKDGKHLISAGLDDTVRIWDVQSGIAQATLLSFYNFDTFSVDEWVSISSDGYFNTSKKGAQELNIRTGPLSVTGIDAYYEQFYRPELVKLALAGISVNSEARLADLKTPPRVEFIETKDISNSDNIKVTLKITDLGGGIGDIRLYRNDTAVKLDGARALRREKKTDKVLIKSYTIKLENGSNELKAIAFDAKNWGRSEYATHIVTANIAAKKPALHAVVIGIETYRNPKLNLKYAVNDAEVFARSLQKYSGELFSNVSISLLTTEANTNKEAIVQKLKTMQSLSPEDLFVFYVASHGTVDDGTYYLMTSNVGSTSTRQLKQDAISQETLKGLISNIPTSKKMIVLDTCNSQALGDSLQVAMLTRGMSEDTAVKVLSRAVGSTILSAATSAQEALEGYKGHGLFTYVLAEGLKGKADKDKDGYVKTNELADYIEDKVPELAEKVFGREQFPMPARNGQSYPVSNIYRFKSK